MTKRISIHILAIGLIGILLVPITGYAHDVGGQNPPEKVHKVIEVLYDLDPEDVHDKVWHDFNNYGNRPHNNPALRDGYEGGHAGYDVAHHEDDEAPFYSLTDGKVIKVVHPDPDDIKKLSHIAIYNATGNTVLYLHPSAIYVEEGDPVKVGTPLGEQGNTGNSTIPHVHLEVRKNRSEVASWGIAASKRTKRPNVDPIHFLYEHVKDFNRGADNKRPDLEKVHKVVEVLYGLDPEDVHDEVAYDFNNYGNRPHNNPALCDGYEGGHSGYDVAHEDDDAPFYSLTDGEVINVKHPNPNNIKVLSYISIYNATHNKTVFYLHPSDIDIGIGQRVEVGDYLGKQGNTGNSTNPHVHLEVRKGWSKLPSCGIAAAKRTDRPNEDPIPFLYEEARNFVHPDIQIVDLAPVVFKKPDLVVEVEIELESITLEPGEKFKLYSNLKNQGTAESEKTKLRYYKSTNDRITSGDTQIGWGNRNPLAPNATIRKYLTVTAPTKLGTYYYGACVDAVDDESDTANNCSEAVRVIVDSGAEISLTLPDDLISEVAFGPNSTYFVLNAQYPILTGASGDLSYGRCILTLDLPDVPDNTLLGTAWLTVLERFIQAIDEIDRTIPLFQFLDQLGVSPFDFVADVGAGVFLPNTRKYFMFPLETMQEVRDKIQEEAIRSQNITLITAAIGSLPLAGDVGGAIVSLGIIELERLLALIELVQSTMDPKIHLSPGIGDIVNAIIGDRSILDVFIDFFDRDSRPNDRLRYLIYIPQRVEKIDVMVEQKYNFKGQSEELTYKDTWNLVGGPLLAPSAQLMSLSDYPPFQMLRPEAQDYLLQHFGSIVNAGDWQIPKETSLLPNYPNPFNPETWIPYQLAAPADVTVSIFAVDGSVVRTLALGHQPVGIYQDKSRAAYWDGKNALGEPVASGVYFYTLKAGDFTATRKMLIRK